MHTVRAMATAHGSDPLRDLAPADHTYTNYSTAKIAKLMESEENRYDKAGNHILNRKKDESLL
ncbi:hypothetical protein Bhyg_10463, partial [Pseudolycoriella hygida]